MIWGPWLRILVLYKLNLEAERKKIFSSKHRHVIISSPTDIHVILPSFSLSFSLSLIFHLFISPSPLHLPLSPPPSCLFISLNSSSPMGFSTICLFISHGFFPYLFTSPIDCILNFLFKLSTTHYPNNWWCCAWNFFYPLCFYGGLCMKYAIFFPLLLFDLICGFCGMCYY